jgi:hypothetical protein
MEKISVRLLVLAAAVIASNLVGTDDKTGQIKHVEQISSEELNATVRAAEFCVPAEPNREENS